MGRGRGRGRKAVTTGGRSHEDNNGQEVVPARKRRGRPLKHRVSAVADKLGLAEANNSVHGAAYHHHQQQGEGDDPELKENYSDGNGTKRNRIPKEEEDSSLNPYMEENSWSTNDESVAATRSSGGGFRLNGSRRKSTPRRAAEAGI